MPTREPRPRKSRLKAPVSDGGARKAPLVAPASDTQKAEWDGPSWSQVFAFLVEAVVRILPIVLGGLKKK